ncbi:MAG TPA: ThuA domain-containing protein [Gemmataceae bacterium]|jgi:putative heme-binding domain-containing protein
MMLRTATLLSLFVLVSLTITAAAGQDATPLEKWRHPDLKVTAGLQLWLDAARQNAARRALRRPELHDGDRVDMWYDASGHGRHLPQIHTRAQPTFHDADNVVAARFDGDDAYLTLRGLKQTFRDVTIFVVAAPFANPGDFRAFLAMNQDGKNDYTSGLTLDMGPSGSERFQSLNPEGAGFGGAINLMKGAFAFGTGHRITIASTPGAGGTRLWIDGKLAGRRDRADSRLHMDQLTVGARCYNNEGGPPNVRGFLAGDILEVLLYDRVLADDERAAVERYLAARHGEIKIAIPRRPGAGKPLVRVSDPPPVQMLVPGFSVRQLTVDLPNINNVRYRSDGKLLALAYNGDIYLLSRSKDGDLEDKAELFWESKGRLRAPIGMAVTPPGCKHGAGVFVASKGKLSLIVDTDGDDKADKEIVVAQGWKELPHGVDALGVAVDGDGNIYFGLGCADYTNAYQIDGQGKARYDLKSERGTILKVSPDFKTREIVATGVRFSVGLAFNRRGDLFATDQEGATWLPNGNPFDELLHIQAGRHYGFPPRHPRHLPKVIDEPSVFDYEPQHQSTCGLAFNESVNKGRVFGPSWWTGDAILTGYSRGKLYRTQLVKTAGGYVARTNLLACLNMLAVDACVSPRGDLVVAVHGGAPDWGNGPTGRGKLYQIHYRGADRPQPVLVWASGPREVRIAFDGPLDPESLRGLARRTSIEYGRYVYPGDRFESQRPGYEAVRRQLTAPRFELPVLGAQVSVDRRTLLLTTTPHPQAVPYAVTLPGMGRPTAPVSGDLPQVSAVDLGYDLTGVTAEWRGRAEGAKWSGWLPHLDLTAARAFIAVSAEHQQLWRAMKQPGRLTLRGQLDLWQMLRPAVQLGSTIGYTLPDEEVTLTFTASGPLTLKTPAGERIAEKGEDGRCRARVTLRPKEGEPLPVELTLDTSGETALDVTWATKEDGRSRALPLRRILLPWAAVKKPVETVAERAVPELKGGSWTRGRTVFFSEQAQCSNCHRLRGRGGDIGPDLSNLVHRDYDSVLRDIRDPNAAINPDYITSVVELKNGRVLTGTVRTLSKDKLAVGDGSGKEITIARTSIETLTPAPISTMPVGLDKVLGPEKLRDLLTFLLTEPLIPAALERPGSPPPRRRAEVEAVLKGSEPSPQSRKKLHIVLSAGPKDHGPGEHDYPLWQRRWFNLLSVAEDVRVSTADGWPTPRQFETADVIVFYSNNPGWTAARAKELDAYLRRGGGLVYLHYAVDGHADVDALKERIGLAWRGGASKFRHGPLELDFTASKHPIARGFVKLSLVDESYWNLIGDVRTIDVLAVGLEEKTPQPLLWTRQAGKGRVFVSIPGHYTWTFDDPLFRVLLLRGLAWTAGESVDRFNELATLGARLVD